MSSSVRPALPSLLAAAGLAVAGCASTSAVEIEPAAGSGTDPATPVTVVATAYPMEYLAARVGGGLVTVENLTLAGNQPHDLEISPADAARVREEAALIVYIDHFQGSVDALVAEAGVPAFDMKGSGDALEREGIDAQDTEALELDPHVWFDPLRMSVAAQDLAAELTAVHPEGSETFQANADAFSAELTALDAAYTEGLSSCERDVIVVSHEAYGYLEAAYGLEQAGLQGFDPEIEPSPATVREIEEVITTNGVTTIFIETMLSPDVAEVLADDLGIETALLSPLEGGPEGGGDYLSTMESNLEALRAALGCA
ncbi:metal ABC transporter substrate-binding protein [Serinibacter salmoneus]|uniref:Zinc transport system substrate-binding protein n=1 Tax=Serinibacter salmoneus TaxID=556530 RepID=A0A2A9CZY1_9MICO|nr:metal ABC transporter substrate-binding protein [Serinibacter salmoneus]PFG20008.1 zinc transport system substrate-binding protein [Serinibacter salmoneus]